MCETGRYYSLSSFANFLSVVNFIYHSVVWFRSSDGDELESSAEVVAALEIAEDDARQSNETGKFFLSKKIVRPTITHFVLHRDRTVKPPTQLVV